MKRIIFGIVLFCIIISGSTYLYPTEEISGTSNEIFLHMGISPFTFHTNLSFYNGKRITIAFKLSMYGGFDIYPSYDLAIIYELPLIKSRYWFFSIGTGIGFIAGDEIDNKFAFNIPVESKIFFMLSKKTGIGIFGLYNINKSEGAEWGGGICLKFKL